MKLFTGENKGTSIPAGASRLWNPLRAPPTSTLDSTSTRICGWLVRKDIFAADRYNLDRCKKCWLHQDHLPCERGSPKFILRTRIVLSDTSCKDVRVHRQQANNIGRDSTFKSVCENSSKSDFLQKLHRSSLVWYLVHHQQANRVNSTGSESTFKFCKILVFCPVWKTGSDKVQKPSHWCAKEEKERTLSFWEYTGLYFRCDFTLQADTSTKLQTFSGQF